MGSLRPKPHSESLPQKQERQEQTENQREQPGVENNIKGAGKMTQWVKGFAMQAW